MPEISVIICTHNPREDYLRRVLDALQAQTLPVQDWELLLVDNASEKPLANRFDLSWHPKARHIREDRIGKTHALLRAITEFQGQLLVIVDDDNVLRADYLQNSLKISADYPWLGAWGGSCIPEFEVEPPAELRPWLTGLVIEKLSTPIWAKLQRFSEASPPGAGMVVRRNVAVHYRTLAFKDPLRQSLGRCGKSLAAGEDGDMAMSGFELGLGTGRFPDFELTHLIPAHRVTLKYIEDLHTGFGNMRVVLDAIYHPDSAIGETRLGYLRIFLLGVLLFATGKGRVERRIRMAEEKGRLQACRELKKIKSAISGNPGEFSMH